MILYKYLVREILLATVTVTLVVAVIAVGWRFGGYLREAAGGGLTSDVLLLLMWFRLPGLLELIVPFGFFLGIMLAYGRLYADSELLVLEACGFSPTRLVVVTMILALFIAVTTATISLWLTPAGESQMERLFEAQRGLTEFDTLAPGRFQMLNSGKRVTYTRRMDKQGDLEGVFMDELRNLPGDQPAGAGPRSTHTVIADAGSQQVDAVTGERFLVLKNGFRYSGTPGTGNYQVIEFQEYGQLINREIGGLRNPRRSAIPTLELWHNPTLINTVELQWRISLVLLVPVMALLAVPLSKVNRNEGRFSRMVPGLAISFLYVMLLSASRSAVERQEIPLELGLWWVHLAFLTLSLSMFAIDRVGSRRARRH